MAIFYCSSESSTRLTFTLGGITSQSYTRYVVCHWKKASSSSYSTFQAGQIYAYDNDDFYVTLGNSSVLIPGCEYDCYLTLHLNSYAGTLNYTTTYESGVTTISAPTGLTAGTVTKNSIGVSWNSRTGAITYEVRWRETGGSYYYKELSGTSTTITGLKPSTRYEINVCAYGQNRSSSYSSSIYVYTSIGITPWEWLYAKVAGQPFNVSGPEWLAFITKIQDVRSAKGLAPYGFTMTASYYDSEDQFYYWMFRQASQAIDDINGQVPNEFMLVNSGDLIYAWYFATLRTALNNAIASI